MIVATQPRAVVGTRGALCSASCGCQLTHEYLLGDMERSPNFTVETAHFWPESGTRVIGVSGGEVVVWDTASGERVWASRR